MKKYKIGDLVHVYGTVATHEFGDFTAQINYCRGMTARVESNSFKDEIDVTGIREPHKITKSRSLIGKYFTVHPKQCRRVKKSKNK